MDKKINEQKIDKINKRYIWYTGLTDDLLFYIYIDTLFLAIVKGFSAFQIVSISTISLIVGIILQKPLLKIIKRIGNTNSIRVGGIFLILSSIFITFSKSYYLVVLGKIFYEIAFCFKNMGSIIIKNNLALVSRSDEYMKIKSKASTCYSIFTFVISLFSSYLFNFNNYLPMIFCIICTIIGFILSLGIGELSVNGNHGSTKINQKILPRECGVKITKPIFYIILCFAIFYPIVNSSQGNLKLFMQQEMFKVYSVSQTTIYIGIIITISRLVRIFSNLLFGKISKKLSADIVIILPTLLSVSIIFVIMGYNIANSSIIKFTLMSIGYLIILGIRDPFNIYINNLVLENADKKSQQTIITYMEMARKIMRAFLSLVMSVILSGLDMIYVVLLLGVISIFSIFIGMKLYSLIYKKECKLC